MNALHKAEALGHKLEDDPPANTLSNASRHTCKRCGRAVLQNAGNAWGSALTEACVAPPAPTKA